MPILKIETSEYECSHCGYKWTNRVNGQDGPIPSRCAKCKRTGWNDGLSGLRDPISPEERGLRTRLHKFEGYIPNFPSGSVAYKPNELCERFLGIQPRPTIDELEQALNPLELEWDIHKRGGCIEDPDRPGYLKYDREGWEKLLEQETQKRREYMQHIIESRSS
jgi:hypothetical protein